MTIAKAIDYINDKLAGSDQPASDNIETALYRLAEHVGGGSSELEPATADTLGGVKIGDGISVTSDGTISAQSGGGSAFDAEIKVTVPSDSAEPWVCERVSGTYAALSAMLEDGTPPSILVRHFAEVSTRGYCTTMTFVQPGGEGVLSVFYVIAYENGNPAFDYKYLIWYENDTIELD